MLNCFSFVFFQLIFIWFFSGMLLYFSKPLFNMTAVHFNVMVFLIIYRCNKSPYPNMFQILFHTRYCPDFVCVLVVKFVLHTPPPHPPRFLGVWFVEILYKFLTIKKKNYSSIINIFHFNLF